MDRILFKTGFLLFFIFAAFGGLSSTSAATCLEESGSEIADCISFFTNGSPSGKHGNYPWTSELRHVGVVAVNVDFEFLVGLGVKEKFSVKEITYLSKQTSLPHLIGPYPVHDAKVLERIRKSKVDAKLRFWAAAEARKSVDGALRQQGWKRGSGSLLCVLRADPSDPGAVYIRTLDDPDVTPLMLAVQDNNLARVQELISTSDVNARDQDGNTALLHGRSASEPIISSLIAAGADINAQNKSGESALMQVAYIGNAKAVEILLAHHADVSQSNAYGKAALAHALSARVPSLEVVVALTKAGADVNKVDDRGKTPLIYAVICGCPSIVDYLLSRGADPSLQDKQGKRAIDYAQDAELASQGSNKLVELLVRSGAQASTLPKPRK